MRILETSEVPYEVVSYQVNPDKLDAVHAADELGLNHDLVYKTIVMTTEDKKLFVFCLPSEFEISLKKARALTGAKQIDLIKMEKLQSLTGYIRGGCSPLGMIHPYPTFIEELALLEDRIYVSAGQRGMQLLLKPLDLAKCCQAKFASFT